MKPNNFVTKAIYDSKTSTVLSEWENDFQRPLFSLNCWKGIRRLSLTEEQAVKFEEDFGQWIADAINEKIQREITELERLREDSYNEFIAQRKIKTLTV